jgi:hypothetical protein
MLFRLLKSVKKWAYSVLFENKIAEAEERIYFRESNKK